MEFPVVWWLNHLGISVPGSIIWKISFGNPKPWKGESDREVATSWCNNWIDDCGVISMSLLAPSQIIFGNRPWISPNCLQLEIQELQLSKSNNVLGKVKKLFIYNIERERTWVDDCESNDIQFVASTNVIDSGSIGISQSCMQFFIASVFNLANLLMLLGMVTILVPHRERFFHVGK